MNPENAGTVADPVLELMEGGGGFISLALPAFLVTSFFTQNKGDTQNKWGRGHPFTGSATTV